MAQNCNKNRPKHNITDLKIRFFFKGNSNIKKDISKEVDINGDMRRRKGELKMSKGREKSNRKQLGFKSLILEFPLVLGLLSFLVISVTNLQFPI